MPAEDNMPDLKHIAALEVAKYWQEFGTPTKSQCIKIAEQAIEAYLKLVQAHSLTTLKSLALVFLTS